MSAAGKEAEVREPPGGVVAREAVIAADGARSEAIVVPGRGRSRAVVIALPAMGAPARFYEPFAKALAARELDVVIAENRGTGTSDRVARRGVDFGYHTMAALDVPAVLGLARARFPGRPIHLLGHSLGGHIGAVFAATNPGAIESLLLVACGTVDFRAYSGIDALRILAGTQLAAGIAALLGFFPGDRLGFGGRQPRGVIRDWARLARTGALHPDGAPRDVEEALRGARLDVLAVSVEADGLSPERSTDHLCAKLASARVTRRRVAIEAGKGDPHFRWARHPGPVVEAVDGFLRV